MATKTRHQHRVKTRKMSPFDHCANPDRCNPIAHGWASYREECRCGAHRTRNSNGDHQEVGPWEMD